MGLLQEFQRILRFSRIYVINSCQKGYIRIRYEYYFLHVQYGILYLFDHPFVLNTTIISVASALETWSKEYLV